MICVLCEEGRAKRAWSCGGNFEVFRPPADRNRKRRGEPTSGLHPGVTDVAKIYRFSGLFYLESH